MKNLTDWGFSFRTEDTGKIHELEYKKIEITQSDQQRENTLKKIKGVPAPLGESKRVSIHSSRGSG